MMNVGMDQKSSNPRFNAVFRSATVMCLMAGAAKTVRSTPTDCMSAMDRSSREQDQTSRKPPVGFLLSGRISGQGRHWLRRRAYSYGWPMSPFRCTTGLGQRERYFKLLVVKLAPAPAANGDFERLE